MQNENAVNLDVLSRKGLLDVAKKHGIKLSKDARKNMATLKATIGAALAPTQEAPVVGGNGPEGLKARFAAKLAPVVAKRAKAPKAEPKPAKPAEETKRGKQGQIVRSIEGVGVQAMWQRFFLQNEEAWAGRQQKLLLSDEQITEAMRSAFPGRESAIFTEVRRVRARWNRGAWGSSLKEDRPTSRRYVLNGDGKFHRADSRGNPIK